MSAELVPISKMPSAALFYPSVPEIAWDFPMPLEIDTERILFDKDAMRRVQRVAALSSGHIRAASDRPSGHLGLLLKHDETLGWSTIEDYYRGLAASTINKVYYKARATHYLDSLQLQNTVGSMVAGGDTPERAWATGLNRALVKSVNHAARQHLIDRERKVTRVGDTALCSLVGITGAANIAVSQPEYAYIGVGFVGAVSLILVGAQGLMMEAATRDDHISERRWSLNPFGTWQPDRYLATLALNKITSLVRYRE